nr:MAG TPA: hypothetical protein [Caudoviricetes sp.]
MVIRIQGVYKNLSDNLSIYDIYRGDGFDTESGIRAFDKLTMVYEAKVYGKSL